jgi:UPF0716 protein FxsA
MGLAFLLYVIIELAAVVAVAWAIGIGWTILLLVTGAVVGSWLARREWARAFRALSGTMRRGGSPEAEVTDSVLVGIGGVLILLPGFVSDLAGFAALLPPTRGVLRRRWLAAARRRSPGMARADMRGGHVVVDSEIVNDPRPPSPRRPFEGAVIESRDSAER